MFGPVGSAVRDSYLPRVLVYISGEEILALQYPNPNTLENSLDLRAQFCCSCFAAAAAVFPSNLYATLIGSSL